MGRPERAFLSEAEAAPDGLSWYGNVEYYNVTRDFAECQRVHMVRGAVPETLEATAIPEVCYFSLDMNCTAHKIAAIEHFCPKITLGGFVLLDDYADSGYEEQNVAFNAFATRAGTAILSLPTGKGLLIKLPAPHN